VTALTYQSQTHNRHSRSHHQPTSRRRTSSLRLSVPVQSISVPTPVDPASIPLPSSPIPPDSIATSRLRRNAKAPTRDDDTRYTVSSDGPRKPPAEHASVAQVANAPEPRTYAKAMARPDAAQWEAASEEEICVFQRLGIYEVVPRSKNRRVVGSKCIQGQKGTGRADNQVQGKGPRVHAGRRDRLR
jgi:hypothetical protein